ncbi:MAG: S41 family peptidase [Candidatus Thorarchaeota archaeon]
MCLIRQSISTCTKERGSISKELPLDVRKAVVTNTIKIVREKYVFPEKSIEIADYIQEKLDNGRYHELTTVREFCPALRDDLREVSQDGHLGVFYWPDKAAKLREKDSDIEDPEEWFQHYQGNNYGLIKAEYLRGNVGYLDIQIFAPLSKSKETLIHMMNFISNCDALIIDVRNNGGGDPYLVQLLESYFFDGPPKLLLTLHKRDVDSSEQIRTIPHLIGKHLPSIPLYILTSRRSFSGAEDFSYTLKHHDRATIVGEPSSGGAHTTDEEVVHSDFVIHIPTGYPIHPVTGENWEGTGVEPDIAVPHEQALGAAHIHAIETLIENASNDIRIRRMRFELVRLHALYTPIEIPRDSLSKYVGTYGEYFVDFMNSRLCVFSNKDEGIQWDLVPMGENMFFIENDDEYNIRFDVDGSEKVTTLVFLHWNRDKESPYLRNED